MKKINKSLMGMAIIISGISPNYAGNDELPGKSAAKSAKKAHADKNISSPPGKKTSSSLWGAFSGKTQKTTFQGTDAGMDNSKHQGGAGLWLTPRSDYAADQTMNIITIADIKAKGGPGSHGGHGIMIDAGFNHIKIDDCTIQGGPVLKDSSKSNNISAKAHQAGGAGVFSPPLKDVAMVPSRNEAAKNISPADRNKITKIDFNKSTITGGQGNDFLAGKGMDIRGPADITLTHASISSGSHGQAADAITMDSGYLTLTNSEVKSRGAAGLSVTGPAVIKIVSPSKIEGGLSSGVGIHVNKWCKVELSGKVYGSENAVLFKGDENELTLKKDFQLRGKLKSLGKDNQLNLMSQNNDENKFYLSSLAANNDHPGFSLDKTGKGHWTLYDDNRHSSFERILVSEGSLTLAEESMDQTTRYGQANAETALGQREREQTVQSPIVDMAANLHSKEIHIEPAAAFGGRGMVNGRVENCGTLLCGSQKNSFTAPHYLLIDGSYRGEGGSSLAIDAKLAGNDDTLTNKLIINGEVSGKSKVEIHNCGGTGGAVKGIPIIKVNHAKPLPADTFYLEKPVEAGSFQYFLKQENNHWLLTTEQPVAQAYPAEQPLAYQTGLHQDIEPAGANDLPPAKPPRRRIKTSGTDLSQSISATSPSPALPLPGASSELIREETERDGAVVPSIAGKNDLLAEPINVSINHTANGKSESSIVSINTESHQLLNNKSPEIMLAPAKIGDSADTNQLGLPGDNSAPIASAKAPEIAQEIVRVATPYSPALKPIIEDVQPSSQQAMLSDMTEGITVASTAVPLKPAATDRQIRTASTDLRPEADLHVSEIASDIVAAIEPETVFVSEEADLHVSEIAPDNVAVIDPETASVNEEADLIISELVSDIIPATDPEATPVSESPSPMASVAPLAPAADYRELPPPESGVIAANLFAANTMFATRMHDRLGNPAYPATWGYDNAEGRPALWLRAVGSRNKAVMADGGIMTQTHLQRVQLGGEIFHATRNGADGWHLGLMAGQGKSHSKSRSISDGADATGGISGYAAGIYGTWHHDEEQRKGLYLDGSLNYNWFDHRVRGKSGTEQHYRSHGLVGTFEAGYHQKWHQGKGYRAYLQPQAQLTWMGVRAEQAVINQQTLSSRGSDNIQSRLGARVYIEKHAEDRQLTSQPYIETSWIHNTRPFGVECNGRTLSQQGSSHIAEFKIGHEGQISRDVALWGSLAHQIGGGDYSNTAGTLGLTIRF